MQIFSLVLAFIIAFSSVALAYSDIGMLKTPKTISYFILNQTDTSNGLSSGLVYDQKQSDKWALEISYTGYKSVYLYTNNIMKFRFDEKYRVGKIGPVGLIGLIGAALYYSKSVGGGLAADAGGIVTLDIVENLAFSLQLNGIFFKDGLEMNVEPEFHLVPAFINKDIEVYAGGRVEGSMVGYTFDGSQGGKFNTNINVGIRAGF